MEKDDYFITGYTGFCPDMADHIGCNYHRATRKTIKAHPHLKTRLSEVHYPHETTIDSHCNQGDYNHCCSAPPQYVPGYQVTVPPKLWYPCHGDGRESNNGGCPEPAYPLSCSEWGSPCVSKHCNEMYAPCLERKNCTCHNFTRMPDGTTCSQNIQQVYQPGSKSCCSSCARGGPCIGDSGSGTSNCTKDGKAYKVLQGVVPPHRKGGVIPNYMGFIPGMQSSFGEPFGTAASRLLRRHFDELSRKVS